MGHRSRSAETPSAGDVRRLPAVGEPVGVAARDRGGGAARSALLGGRARAVAAGRDRGDRGCGDRREPDARPWWADRCRRAGTGDGADARAARASRFVRADRAEHPPVPRLVGLRADRDRDRGERALAPGVRLRRDCVLEDPVRRARDGSRAARAGRVRAPVRAQVRGLGCGRVAPLSLVVVAARAARRRALAPAGVACVLAGVRPRDREHHLVDAARGRLHALLEEPLRGILGCRARILRADDPAVRARSRDRDVTVDRGRARAPDRDRCRRAPRASSRCSP